MKGLSLILLLSPAVLAKPLHQHHKRFHAHHLHEKRGVVYKTVYETNWHTVWVPCATDKPEAIANPPEAKHTSPPENPYNSAPGQHRETPQPPAPVPAEIPKANPGPVLVDSSPPIVQNNPVDNDVPPPPSPPSNPQPHRHHDQDRQPPKTDDKPQPSGGSGGHAYEGKGTFYDPTIGAGSCGTTAGAGDRVCAVSFVKVDTYNSGGNPNKSPMCGKKIRITNTKNGKTTTCTAIDRCPGCKSAGDLDMDEGTFTQLAAKDDGICQIQWSYENWDETGGPLAEPYTG